MSEYKHPGGRPTKYRPDYHPKMVYKLCLLNATDEKIADAFDISVATFYNWELQHPEFLESVKKGKAVADAEVANNLFKKANGYRYREKKIEKDESGNTIRETITTKFIPPDTAAAFIILKNRAGWRDKQDHDVNVKYTVVPAPESKEDQES